MEPLIIFVSRLGMLGQNKNPSSQFAIMAKQIQANSLRFQRHFLPPTKTSILALASIFVYYSIE